MGGGSVVGRRCPYRSGCGFQGAEAQAQGRGGGYDHRVARFVRSLKSLHSRATGTCDDLLRGGGARACEYMEYGGFRNRRNACGDGLEGHEKVVSERASG